MKSEEQTESSLTHSGTIRFVLFWVFDIPFSEYVYSCIFILILSGYFLYRLQFKFFSSLSFLWTVCSVFFLYSDNISVPNV